MFCSELRDNFSKSDLIGNILLVARGFSLPKEIWCVFASYYLRVKDKLTKELLGEVNVLWVIKKLITAWKQEFRYELISLHINPDYNPPLYDADNQDADNQDVDNLDSDNLKIVPKDITNSQRNEFFEYTSIWNSFSRIFDSLFRNSDDYINIITVHVFTTIFRVALFFIYSKVQKKWYILGSLVGICILGMLGSSPN